VTQTPLVLRLAREGSRQRAFLIKRNQTNVFARNVSIEDSVRHSLKAFESKDTVDFVRGLDHPAGPVDLDKEEQESK
jgi:hypothetical protein